MTEAELSKIIVRLVGDVEKYLKDMKRAEKATEDMSKKVEKDADATKLLGEELGRLGTEMSNIAGQQQALASLHVPFQKLKEAIGLSCRR